MSSLVKCTISFTLLLFFSWVAAAQNNPKADSAASSAAPAPKASVARPQYPGGAAGMRRDIADNLFYPAEAKKKKIEGQVLVRFEVDEKGRIVNPQIQQSVHPLLDAEALRVVGKLRRWKVTELPPSGTTGFSMTVAIGFSLQ